MFLRLAYRHTVLFKHCLNVVGQCCICCERLSSLSDDILIHLTHLTSLQVISCRLVSGFHLYMASICHFDGCNDGKNEFFINRAYRDHYLWPERYLKTNW